MADATPDFTGLLGLSCIHGGSAGLANCLFQRKDMVRSGCGRFSATPWIQRWCCDGIVIARNQENPIAGRSRSC